MLQNTDSTKSVTAGVPAAGNAGAPPATAPAGKSALSEGLALSISGAVGSLAGFASWLIAARMMPQEAVGYGSAFVSAFLLVAGTAQLNLDSAMMLWMPRSGRRAPTLFWRSHAVIVPACAAVGLAYVALEPTLARTGAGNGPIALGVGLFVIAGIGWGLWGMHDFSLVAIGKGWWAAWRNVVFAVVRIVLLLALGASLGAQGIVLSWVIPIAVWTLGSAVLVGAFTSRFARKADTGWMPTRKEAVTFLGPTTVAHWGTVLLLNQVTVIVVQRFGPVPGAAFFIAWQGVMVIDITAQRFMQSLSSQIARDPERRKEYIAASRRRLLVIFLPMVVVGIVLADWGLGIFGPGYAEAATVLRVLLIGMIPRLLIAHELGKRQALHDGMGFARLQLVSTLLVIAVVLFVPIDDPDASGGYAVASLLPVAIGYAVVQALCAAGVVITPLLRRAVGLRQS
ncbi:lipopolysaccharide biosynthesis protein [Pseudonocardia sp. GCM10023141]|uniref:lipopolysaccharide biosynthesis protein n=1 Tax=Pseudonocardia sp. GCM10023141 TaxID=3252653 RepID=UPI00362230C3